MGRSDITEDDFIKENHNETHIRCSYKTMGLIRDCKEVFIKHNPQCTGMKISDGFILKRIARYYKEN
jgi:hypothetical protein